MTNIAVTQMVIPPGEVCGEFEIPQEIYELLEIHANSGVSGLVTNYTVRKNLGEPSFCIYTPDRQTVLYNVRQRYNRFDKPMLFFIASKAGGAPGAVVDITYKFYVEDDTDVTEN